MADFKTGEYTFRNIERPVADFVNPYYALELIRKARQQGLPFENEKETEK